MHLSIGQILHWHCGPDPWSHLTCRALHLRSGSRYARGSLCSRLDFEESGQGKANVSAAIDFSTWSCYASTTSKLFKLFLAVKMLLCTSLLCCLAPRLHCFVCGQPSRGTSCQWTSCTRSIPRQRTPFGYIEGKRAYQTNWVPERCFSGTSIVSETFWPPDSP